MVALQRGFIEIYFLGVGHPPPDLEPEFTSYVTLWRHYKALRDIAAARGVQIFNATCGGLLGVFPRVELASLPALAAGGRKP